MVDQPSSRAAVARTTTAVITNNLYEAAFSTTRTHPQCGVALTRTIAEARHRLADMLFLCDSATPAIADITDARAVRTIRTYSGSVSEVYAQLTTEEPAADHYTGTPGDITAQYATAQNAKDAR